ncbi:hypothetical protein AB0M34_05920 [Nocardia sp. NPDC050193]
MTVESTVSHAVHGTQVSTPPMLIRCVLGISAGDEMPISAAKSGAG